MHKIIVLLTLVIILTSINGLIYQKQQVLAEGTTILLQLMPLDPRSLMQGDYMHLQYKMARDIELSSMEDHRGKLVVTLDQQQRATFKRLYQQKIPLQPNEHLLVFHRRGTQIYIGAETFFFQEGLARQYDKARYGELKVDKTGKSVLVGLRDEQLKPLGTKDLL